MPSGRLSTEQGGRGSDRGDAAIDDAGPGDADPGDAGPRDKSTDKNDSRRTGCLQYTIS